MLRKTVFSVLTLLLTLLTQDSLAAASSNEFSGLKGGFFNRPPSTTRTSEPAPPPPSAESKELVIAPPPTALSIWEDPKLQGPDVRKEIYDFLEKYWKKNSHNPGYEDTLPRDCSNGFLEGFLTLNKYFYLQNAETHFKQVIAADFPMLLDPIPGYKPGDDIVHFNQFLHAFLFAMANYTLQSTYDFQHASHLKNITLVLTDQILSALFNSCSEPLKQKKYREWILTKSSNTHQGELCTPQDAKYKCYYFVETDLKGQKHYRLYNELDVRTISDSPQLGYICFGREVASLATSDSANEKRSLRRGFLLDKTRGLIEQKGLLLTCDRQGFFPKGFIIFAYDRDPITGSMFLDRRGAFTEKDLKKSSPLLQLITLAGGIERVRKETLVLIPEPGSVDLPDISMADIPVADAETFLPYALQLQSLSNDIIDKPLLTYAITAMEKIIANSPDSQALISRLEQETAAELASEQVDEALAKGDAALAQIVKEESATLYTAIAYPEPKKKREAWRTSKKQEAKAETIKKIKAARAKAQDSESVRKRAKEKLLEKIRAKYVQKAAEKPHYSSSETQDLLQEMTQAFSKAGIATATGVSRIRGSHENKEIAVRAVGTSTAAGSTSFGLAHRPQSDGYQAGTVRTIINNRFSQLMHILRKSHAATVAAAAASALTEREK